MSILSRCYSMSVGLLVMFLFLAGCGGAMPESAEVSEPLEEPAEEAPSEEEPAEEAPAEEAPVEEAATMIAASQATAVPTPQSVAAVLEEVDAALRNSLPGAIAHNVPTQSMLVDEIVEVQLLISPSMAPENLQEAVDAAGPVVSSAIEITPWMRAELSSLDPEAFFITRSHGDTDQPLSNTEPTEWRWTIQAHQPGSQRLFITVHRLVEVDGRESWRKVEEYRHEMDVEVTWAYRLATWGQTLASNVLFPVVVILLGGLLTWLAQRWWRQR